MDQEHSLSSPTMLPGAEAKARKVLAIIVSYHPNQKQLLELCTVLITDGAQIIIVDNTEASYLDPTLFPKECHIIIQGFNTGIAHAQNVGIQKALSAGAKIIVMFDQDSTLQPGFLSTLVSPLRIGTPDIVSPLCVDEVSNSELPSIRLGKYGISSLVLRKDSQLPHDVDIVISSGTAATCEVFKVAGLFDEGLFIDFVDTEWCLRCRKHGIPIRVIPQAIMQHRIGTKAHRIGRFNIVEHSPRRCYYQIRNCFHLFRKPHIPFLFALKETLSVFFSRFLLLFFVSHRSEYLNAYFAAIRDGLLGIKGAKPS